MFSTSSWIAYEAKPLFVNWNGLAVSRMFAFMFSVPIKSLCESESSWSERKRKFEEARCATLLPPFGDIKSPRLFTLGDAV